jgi:hypothetical protein
MPNKAMEPRLPPGSSPKPLDLSSVRNGHSMCIRTKTTAIVCLISITGYVASASCGQSSSVHEAMLSVYWTAPSEESVEIDYYLWHPRSVVRIGDSLFVADSRRNEVQVYTLEGEPIGVFGGKGFGPGELIEVLGLERSPDNQSVYLLQHGGNRVDRFRTDGVFVNGLMLPRSCSSLDVLPEQRGIACVGYATNTLGGLFLVSPEGRILFEVSPPIDVSSKAFSAQMQTSLVVVIDTEIWQVWTNFNHVRVFSFSGQMIREFGIQDELIKATDEIYRQRLAEGATSSRFIFSAKAHDGYLWLSANIAPSVVKMGASAYYLFKVTADGQAVARYYLPIKTPLRAVMDFEILEDSNNLRAILAVVGEASLWWVSTNGSS